MDGKTIPEAQKLAQTAFLDYGNLPQFMKTDYARLALYTSFMWRTYAETVRALGDANAAAQLARLAKYHQEMTKWTGTRLYNGDQALQSLWITANEGDGDFSSASLYYRDPWMGSLVQAANALNYTLRFAQGDPTATIAGGVEGLLNSVYIPYMDLISDLDPDYKKGVPPKTVYQILAAQSAADMIPGIDRADVGEFFIDRYDLEVRPAQVMVPNAPLYNNYQFRFTTPSGYNKFILDSQALALLGVKRSMDDATGALIAGGILPEGTEFGYLESGRPVWYLLGRERYIPIPPEWERKDAMLRKYQQNIRQIEKTFGEQNK